MAQNDILDRIRVAALGKFNALLDEVANNTDAYKQRIRDLESALASMRANKDEATGTVNGYKRRLDADRSQIATKQADIDLILGDGDDSNDGAALQLQLDIERLNENVATYTELLQDAQNDADGIQQAIGLLEDKHAQMLTDLNKLTLTEASTKAKNRASHAAEAAQKASSAAGSVDSIQARLEHENDVANARFERVIGGMQSTQSPEDAARAARAKAALEARRQQIIQQAVATETPAD